MLSVSDHFIEDLPALIGVSNLQKFFDKHSHLYVENENINNPLSVLFGVRFHNILLLTDFTRMQFQAAINVAIDDENHMESAADSMYFTNSMLVLFTGFKLFDWGSHPRRNIARVIFEYISEDNIVMYMNFRYNGLVRVGRVTTGSD